MCVCESVRAHDGAGDSITNRRHNTSSGGNGGGGCGGGGGVTRTNGDIACGVSYTHNTATHLVDGMRLP